MPYLPESTTKGQGNDATTLQPSTGELLGVLMLWPAMRKWYAMAVVALFGSLIIMYGIFELSWPAMACALAWSSMGSQTLQK